MDELIKPIESNSYVFLYESLVRFIGNIIGTTFGNEIDNCEININDKIMYYEKMIKSLKTNTGFQDVRFCNFELECREVAKIIEESLINENIIELACNYIKSLDDEYFLSREGNLIASKIEQIFEKIYFEVSIYIIALREQWLEEMTYSYENKINNLSEDIKILEIKNNELNCTVDNLNNTLIDKNKEIELVKKRSVNVSENKYNKESFEKFEEEIELIIKEKEGFKKKLFETIKQINILKKEFIEKNNKITDLNEISIKKDNDINFLNNEISIRDKKIKELEKLIYVKKNEFEEIKRNSIKFTNEEVNNIKFNKIPRIEKLLKQNIFLIFDNKFIYNDCEEVIEKLNIKELNRLIDRKNLTDINKKIDELVSYIEILNVKTRSLDLPINFKTIIDEIKKII